MSEPLGLPRGTVRAVLALVFTGTSAFLFATGQPLPGELLALNGTVVAFYFAQRQEETADEPRVPAPYISDDV